MCLLVISDFGGGQNQEDLAEVAAHIKDRIEEARLNGRAIAYIQSARGPGFEGLGVRIRRYDPVFRSVGRVFQMPPALIDFIVDSAPAQINLIGVAEQRVFERLREIFSRTGYFTRLDARAILNVPEPACD